VPARVLTCVPLVRVQPGRAGRALVAGFTKNVAAAAVAITAGPALAVAGWLAACVAPAVLVDRLPGWAAAACYVAVVVQLAVHLRRLGSFSPLAALAYPVALAVFLAVFVRSAAVTLGRGRVSWKGRSVPTRG